MYRYPGSPADTGKVKFQYEAPREDVRRATIGPDGKPLPGATEIYNYYGREIIITPTLEKREVVVSRTQDRPPRTSIRLMIVAASGIRGRKVGVASVVIA